MIKQKWMLTQHRHQHSEEVDQPDGVRLQPPLFISQPGHPAVVYNYILIAQLLPAILHQPVSHVSEQILPVDRMDVSTQLQQCDNTEPSVKPLLETLSLKKYLTSDWMYYLQWVTNHITVKLFTKPLKRRVKKIIIIMRSFQFLLCFLQLWC